MVIQVPLPDQALHHYPVLNWFYLCLCLCSGFQVLHCVGSANLDPVSICGWTPDSHPSTLDLGKAVRCCSPMPGSKDFSWCLFFTLWFPSRKLPLKKQNKAKQNKTKQAIVWVPGDGAIFTAEAKQGSDLVLFIYNLPIMERKPLLLFFFF